MTGRLSTIADTGLVRFEARDYDATTGRWTAKDPLGVPGHRGTFEPDTGSDPVNYVDPEGLEDRKMIVRVRGVVTTRLVGSKQPVNVLTNRILAAGQLRVEKGSVRQR